MKSVTIVELVDKNFNVFPNIFGIENFFIKSKKPLLNYYGFNKVFSNLDQNLMKIFFSEKEIIKIGIGGFGLSSPEYSSIIKNKVFESLNQFYGFKFKKINELESFEGDLKNKNYFLLNNFVDYKLNYHSIFENILNSKINVNYNSKVDEEVMEYKKEFLRKKFDLFQFNCYLLKIYGLESFIY